MRLLGQVGTPGAGSLQNGVGPEHDWGSAGQFRELGPVTAPQ